MCKVDTLKDIIFHQLTDTHDESFSIENTKTLDMIRSMNDDLLRQYLYRCRTKTSIRTILKRVWHGASPVDMRARVDYYNCRDSICIEFALKFSAEWARDKLIKLFPQSDSDKDSINEMIDAIKVDENDHIYTHKEVTKPKRQECHFEKGKPFSKETNGPITKVLWRGGAWSQFYCEVEVNYMCL